MADLGEIFDGSAVMELCGDRASALGDPIRAPAHSEILANMARFAGAPISVHAQLLDRRASNTDLGEVFDGATVDTGPMSALDELRQHRQWVCWALETRPGATKPTKPPKSPHTGFGASHAKPSDWGTYEQAEAMAARRKFAGVGFILSETDDYTGVDLDRCRDPESGKLDQWADDIVSLGETYWEVSPSGTGLRAFVRGKIEKTVKCDTAHVEVYRSLRYLTFTGDHIDGTPEDIREAPTTLEWLMDRVAQFAPKAQEPHFEPPKVLKEDLGTPARTHNDSGERAWAEAALERNAADLAACGEGGRNHDLNAKAYRMGRMVARGWIEKSRVEAALTDACRANGLFKDDGPKGVRASLASGLRGGMAKPCEDLDDARADEQRLRALGDETARLLIEAGGLEQDNDLQPEGGPREARIVDPLAGFTFHGDAPTEPQPMLVKGLVPRDGIAFIGGQSGAGKTFIACALSVALASGERFFGRKVAERVGVVILAAEGENTIANRIAVASAQNEAGEILPIAWLGSIPDLSNPVEVKKMVYRLRAVSKKMQAEHGVRLGAVIIDTLAAAFGLKDENDNAEATKALRCMMMLADHTRAVVIPVHHYGKAKETGLRGASAWRAGCDAVLSVLADRDETTGKCRNRQLALTKSRVGEEGWIVPFDLRFVELGRDEDGEAFGACYVEPGEKEDSIVTSSKQTALSPAAKAYLAAFRVAVCEKGNKVRPFGSDGSEVNAVDREHVREEFYRAWPAEGDDEKKKAAARQKNFVRGETKAIDRLVIATRECGGAQLVWSIAEPSQ